ncbi:unnamed protein product, partial [Symbiodinium sp. CCMP2456]
AHTAEKEKRLAQLRQEELPDSRDGQDLERWLAEEDPGSGGEFGFSMVCFTDILDGDCMADCMTDSTWASSSQQSTGRMRRTPEELEAMQLRDTTRWREGRSAPTRLPNAEEERRERHRKAALHPDALARQVQQVPKGP